MAIPAALLSPSLVHTAVLTPSLGLGYLLSTKISALSPPLLKLVASKIGLATAAAARLAAEHVRNTRVAPVVTYLAYKAAGGAEQGVVGGMTISDFVAVWAPYNNPSTTPTPQGQGLGRKRGKGGGSGGGGKGSAAGEKGGGGGSEGRAAEQKKTMGGDAVLVAGEGKRSFALGGTKRETGLVVLEKEGRESRPARQSLVFEKRRRHYCRQLGCGKSAL